MVVVGFFGSRRGCPQSVISRIFFEKLLQKFGQNIQVVTGDCIGVDEQVYRFCKSNNISVKVIATYGNWNKISYEPDSNDILEFVGSPAESLRIRLAKRTIRLVEYVKSKKGFLIGINTSGKGSQLAIRTAKRLGVRVYTVNP